MQHLVQGGTCRGVVVQQRPYERGEATRGRVALRQPSQPGAQPLLLRADAAVTGGEERIDSGGQIEQGGAEAVQVGLDPGREIDACRVHLLGRRVPRGVDAQHGFSRPGERLQVDQPQDSLVGDHHVVGVEVPQDPAPVVNRTHHLGQPAGRGERLVRVGSPCVAVVEDQPVEHPAAQCDTGDGLLDQEQVALLLEEGHRARGEAAVGEVLQHPRLVTPQIAGVTPGERGRRVTARLLDDDRAPGVLVHGPVDTSGVGVPDHRAHQEPPVEQHRRGLGRFGAPFGRERIARGPRRRSEPGPAAVADERTVRGDEHRGAHPVAVQRAHPAEDAVPVVHQAVREARTVGQDARPGQPQGCPVQLAGQVPQPVVVAFRVDGEELPAAAALVVPGDQFARTLKGPGELEPAATAYQHLGGTRQHDGGRQRRRRDVQLPALCLLWLARRGDVAPEVPGPYPPPAERARVTVPGACEHRCDDVEQHRVLVHVTCLRSSRRDARSGRGGERSGRGRRPFRSGGP